MQKKRIAIMQPYFLPYIGYWQLINAVDTFVVYDNIQYTKKGWINRNRYLRNGEPATFSLSLKKDSDYLNVIDRSLASAFDRKDLLNKIMEAYKKAPEYPSVVGLLTDIIMFNEDNLFRYILHSIQLICAFMHIDTPVVVSSSLDIDHSLRSADKVIAICKALDAETYVNPIGGLDLYSKDSFHLHNIDLLFLRTSDFTYQQFGFPFVPFLSIIDALMFCPLPILDLAIRNSYCLI